MQRREPKWNGKLGWRGRDFGDGVPERKKPPEPVLMQIVAGRLPRRRHQVDLSEMQSGSDMQ